MVKYVVHKNILSLFLLIGIFFSAQAINVAHEIGHLNIEHDQLCDIYQSYDTPPQLHNPITTLFTEYALPLPQQAPFQIYTQSAYQIYLARAPPVFYSHSV